MRRLYLLLLCSELGLDMTYWVNPFSSLYWKSEIEEQHPEWLVPGTTSGKCGATAICNAEISKWLETRGVKTHAQHIGGGFHYPFGYLKLTQALHGSALPDGSDGGNPAGFLLTTLSGEKVYMAGDTGLFGDMALIGDEGVFLAVIPIGDNYTMGPDDALRAVKLLRPQHVVPIHFNTFPVIQQDADAWCARVSAETQTRVHRLKPGESWSF